MATSMKRRPSIGRGIARLRYWWWQARRRFVLAPQLRRQDRRYDRHIQWGHDADCAPENCGDLPIPLAEPTQRLIDFWKRVLGG